MSNGARNERYERSDANASPVFLAGGALALVVAGSMLASAWVERRLAAGLEPSPENPISELRATPEGPELQAIPTRELAEHRAWEERMLTGTEWVDPVNRIVRIPVERALELALEEGFPVRKEGDK